MIIDDIDKDNNKYNFTATANNESRHHHTCSIQQAAPYSEKVKHSARIIQVLSLNMFGNNKDSLYKYLKLLYASMVGVRGESAAFSCSSSDKEGRKDALGREILALLLININIKGIFKNRSVSTIK